MSPDEVCAVCQTTRENHGDKNHEFDANDSFPRLKKQPEPEKPAQPSLGGPTKQGPTPSEMAMLELIEVLAEKQILNNKDLIRVLSAGH